jgi:hypothetical protein
MSYEDVIAKSLQNCARTAFNIHPIDDVLIMEINYDVLVKTIVDDLESNGYTITTHQ